MTWVGASALDISRAVRRGDTSAGEVVDEHLTYLRRVDGEVGAFRSVRSIPALEEAAAVDEMPDLAALPLAGVPVAVKENLAIVGERTQYGSAATMRAVAERDHEVVRRLRGAGAIVVGQSRMPELGVFAVTDDDDVITRNPWRLDRTAGGSSGGSAAAVASGMVPLALGNDGLGSVRIPAACCGLIGVKPGRGLVPAQISDNDWFGLVENGVLATTVADATVGLAALAGVQRFELPEPDRLTFAVSLRSPVLGVTADTDAVSAVQTVVRALVTAGHSARAHEVSYPLRLGLAGFATWAAATRADAEPFDRSALQPRNRRHATLGRLAEAAGLVREVDRQRWRERAEEFFADGIDVLVTPALATAPPRAIAWSQRGWLANLLASVRYAPYAAPWNLAGLPAMAVPAGARRDGLPAAVQLVGPPGSEWLLLAVAAHIESALPWRRLAPGWPRPDDARSISQTA